MTVPNDDALARLRRYLADANLPFEGRLPPERALCETLGVPRSNLRKALAVLEAEGHVWRHVGKGTFVGSRPLDTHADIAAVARRTSPVEVMRTRILLEPEIAALAALHATPADIGEMWACHRRSRSVESWRQYESWDNRLHRTIAEATQNGLLLSLLDTLNAVRRAVTWGRQRTERERPAPSHHSYSDHETVIRAIEDRDPDRAREAMRLHLERVTHNLLQPGRGTDGRLAPNEAMAAD